MYVAPMKALAAEMAENFHKRLAPYNLRVNEWTGDISLTKREIGETNVFVTTPAKGPTEKPFFGGGTRVPPVGPNGCLPKGGWAFSTERPKN